MTRSRLGLLGLCTVVLGLMAVSASVAQGAAWLILDPDGTSLDAAQLPATLDFEVESGTTANFLVKVLGVTTVILCSAAEYIGVKLESEGKLTTGGKIKFTGCDVTLNGELNKECEAHSNGSPVGTIETLKGKGKLEASGLIKVEPETGTTIVTIEMGASCPIGGKLPVTGTIAFEDSELTSHKVKRLCKVKDASTNVLILGNPTTLDAKLWLFLSGAHAGYSWGGKI